MRDPNLTAILNLLFSGAGYCYLGQWPKGIAAIALGWTLFLTTLFTMTSWLGFILLPLCVVYPLLLAYDGWKEATRQAAAHHAG